MEKATKSKVGPIRRIYAAFNCDIIFICFLLGGVGLLVKANTNLAHVQSPVLAMWPKLPYLVVSLILVVWIVAKISIFDRKYIDDYYYQTTGLGAIIGLFSTFVIVTVWDIASLYLPALSIPDVMGIMMCSWALGYFYYRLRGLSQ